MLTIANVSAAYHRREVLCQVSLSARAGEIVGVIGPNGAGKSSLLRVVSGTLTPVSGTVRLGDVDLARLNAAERARKIAVVPQSARLPHAFTAGEVVLMGRTPHLPPFGAERARDYGIAHAAMARTATLSFAERLVGELSGGEQQRVLIARALAQEPQVLLLDEATVHLDLKHQMAIWELARELARAGLIVIAALHDLNLAAQYADRLALLREGELLACAEPARVLTPEWLRRAYGVSAIVGAHPLYHTPMVALVSEEERSCDKDS
ncbi:MAG: ABC transporter ATP-binding protein [Chloroflexi bacterium]|nr:ABC transporter ATP-binding protein [Chloroflexota bacterium]